jgi:hypothetical protein
MLVETEKRTASADTVAIGESRVVAEPNAVGSSGLSVEDVLPARTEWPGWSMPKFGWWAGAYSVAFTIVGFFYFALTDQRHPWRALIAAFLLPPVAVGCEYVGRCAATVYRRFAQYELLLDVIRLAKYEVAQSREQLSISESLVRDLLVAFGRIEIDLVQVFGGSVFLTLKPKKSMKVDIGNRVRVIDLTDGKAMGTFQITQITPVCLAKALGDLNPLWSGYLHQAGAESSAPPNSAAILIEKE